MIIQDLNYLEAADRAISIAGEGYKWYYPERKKDDKHKPEPKKDDKKKDDKYKFEKEYEKYLNYYPDIKKYLH